MQGHLVSDAGRAAGEVGGAGDRACDQAGDGAGENFDELFCPACGYSLRGLTRGRCPECGLDLGPVRAAGSQMPWVHRRQIGWLRAFWRTVWFVTFRHKRIAAEIARPVSYRDAQLFRWVVAAHLVAGVLLYFGIWLALDAAARTNVFEFLDGVR